MMICSTYDPSPTESTSEKFERVLAKIRTWAKTSGARYGIIEVSIHPMKEEGTILVVTTESVDETHDVVEALSEGFDVHVDFSDGLIHF
jgi:hypothetical protein